MPSRNREVPYRYWEAHGSAPRIANHWRRGGKAYGTRDAFIVVHVWWPISDPCPRGRLWL